MRPRPPRPVARGARAAPCACDARRAAAAAPYVAGAALWVCGLALCGGKVGIVYVCLSFFVLAFCTTSRRVDPNQVHGFSVFNKNFAAPLGQLTSGDFDAAARGGGAAPGGGGDATRAAVEAAAAAAAADAAAFVVGTPLGSADAPPAADSPAALLGALAAARAARARAPPP